jgi:hypothetical protein
MPFRLAAASALLVFGSFANANTTPRAVDPSRITANQLRSFLTFVASDEMEGRNTPSFGLNATARYLVSNLLRWGVKPAGDNGSYFQKIDLVRGETQVKSCKGDLNGKPFVYGDDFFSPPVAAKLSGGLVYGGTGWMVKSKKMDPYADVDVKGKIVILNSGSTYTPPGMNYNELTGKRGEDYADPVAYAKAKGAAGIVWLYGRKALAAWQSTRNQLENDYFFYRMEKFQQPRGDQFPAIYANESMAKALFAGEETAIDDILKSVDEQKSLPSFELNPNKKLNIEIAAGVKREPTQNVIAMIEGRDLKLKDEYVVVSAHYDHVGMRANGQPGQDNIYNGADDDGSGTVSVLALAETLANSPRKPRRSVLFIWHCGEEKGLWGSRYFTNYPTVPIKQIVTDLNIDMIGRSKKAGDKDPRNINLTGPEEIYVIGAKKMSTELGGLCDRVNNHYLKLKYNYKYDDPKDPEGLFYRSDHYNFAVKGIPVAFFFDGVHEDYHQVGDQVEKIDFIKMQKIARTIYLTLWEVAELPHRPSVDKPLKN